MNNSVASRNMAHHKKVLVITNYFGVLPSYFQLWLDSCASNQFLDWMITTDADTSCYEIPSNVKVIKTNYNELKARVQRNFKYPVRYERFWDFTAFKPMFPIIFADELNGYDYYGWCDLDVIFGDLSVVEKYLDEYDKIFPLGHLSLMRKSKDLYAKILAHPLIERAYSLSYQRLPVFDEEGFPKVVLKDLGARIMNDIPFMQPDCHWGHYKMCATVALWKKLGLNEGQSVPGVFTWHKGKLTGHFAMKGRRIECVDLAYMHFFRRPFDASEVKRLLPEKYYLIIPNKIVEYDGHPLTWKEIHQLDRPRINWPFIRARLNLKWIMGKLFN